MFNSGLKFHICMSTNNELLFFFFFFLAFGISRASYEKIFYRKIGKLHYMTIQVLHYSSL